MNCFTHFSAKTFSELRAEGEATTNNLLLAQLEEVCPSQPIDCSSIDLTFRPVNEICNNLLKPRLGIANIAQERIAPALFEDCQYLSEHVQKHIYYFVVDKFNYLLVCGFDKQFYQPMYLSSGSQACFIDISIRQLCTQYLPYNG